jgi:hypothetical protein
MGKMPVRTDLHLIPGVGHSFESHRGVVAPELMDEICRVILGWLDSL